MNYRLLSLLSIALVLGVARAQTCQTIEVPVSPISDTGDLFRGLSAQDFVLVRGSGHLKSLTFDEGPRRILIVADTSKKLSGNTHRAEAALVETLVTASRPEDSLALITARGPGGDVKFGDDRARLPQALALPEKSRAKEGVLDAAMEGMEWFGEPHPGDAIILVAADLDGNHNTNNKAVAKALQQRGIRMFGFALGPVIARSTVASGSQTSTTSQGLAWTTPLTGALIQEQGDENFFPLTTNSGGLLVSLVGAYTEPDNMDNPQVQQRVKQRGQQMLRMISIFYRMQVESPGLTRPQALQLDVSPGVKKAAPRMWLLYPKELGPCRS